MGKDSKNTWLLLMHQLPPKPESLRVRVWRSLQRLGALPIKNSVYAMPNHSFGRKALTDLARAIHDGGGEAIVCESEFLQGVNSAALIEDYNAALTGKFQVVQKELSKLKSMLGKKKTSDLMDAQHSFGRARSLFQEASEQNVFHCAVEEECSRSLESLEAMLTKRASPKPPGGKGKFRARTWVTRSDIRIDRMASAWLIERYIDPQAHFVFVNAKTYRHKKAQIRFDMFGGEFTHENELCTFEVLLKRFALSQPHLQRLGQMIHDLDINDEKYGLPETAGLGAFLEGLAKRVASDQERIREAFLFFDSFDRSLR